MPIEDFLGDTIKQASVSGAERSIGSLYAQLSAYGQTNTGKRIRLEHRHGPTVSEKVKDRYQMTDQQIASRSPPSADDLLKPGKETGQGTRLVEYDHQRKSDGSLGGRHPSRGALVNVGPSFLSEEQVKAIFKVASDADAERRDVLSDADDSEEDPELLIGEKYNPILRALLKGKLFDGHRLQKEALARKD